MFGRRNSGAGNEVRNSQRGESCGICNNRLRFMDGRVEVSSGLVCENCFRPISQASGLTVNDKDTRGVTNALKAVTLADVKAATTGNKAKLQEIVGKVSGGASNRARNRAENRLDNKASGDGCSLCGRNIRETRLAGTIGGFDVQGGMVCLECFRPIEQTNGFTFGQMTNPTVVTAIRHNVTLDDVRGALARDTAALGRIRDVVMGQSSDRSVARADRRADRSSQREGGLLGGLLQGTAPGEKRCLKRWINVMSDVCPSCGAETV